MIIEIIKISTGAVAGVVHCGKPYKCSGKETAIALQDIVIGKDGGIENYRDFNKLGAVKTILIALGLLPDFCP